MAMFGQQPTTGNVPRSQFAYPLTDIGNAQMFYRLFGPEVLWDEERGQWLAWNGKRWLSGKAASVMMMRLFKKLLTALYRQAKSDQPLRTRNGEAVTAIEALKFAKKSSSNSRMKATLELVRDLPGVRVSRADLDLDPCLLGVANGVLDLLTGELIPNRPELRITRYAKAAYRPNANAPIFLGFLNQVCLGRQDLVDFIQEILGYALSGMSKERVMFLLLGAGTNGKTTLVETFLHLIGDYGCAMPSHSFLKSNSRAIRNDIARLPGVRSGSCAEANTETSLDEGMSKRATGTDIMTARFLGKELVDFHCITKFFWSVNTLPRVTGADHAIYRRLCIIPFDGDFESTMDGDLPEKLKAEIDGILAWALVGFQRWHARGHLVKPACVVEACKAYRAEMDTVQSFLDDCCVCRPNSSTPLGILHKAYEDWAKSSSVEPVKLQLFGTLMGQKGFKKKKSGPWRWLGVALKSDSVPAANASLFGTAAAETESGTLPK